MIEISSFAAEAIDSGEVEAIVRAVLASEGVYEPYDVGIRLVADDEIRLLNREHRGNDVVTDVLSFPIDGVEELPSGMDRQLGDVVISPAQAARQATDGMGSELRTLLVHGLLHLLEYDHETDEGVMLARQDALCETLPALSVPG